MATPPSYAAATVYQPGSTVLVYIGDGANAGTYAPAKIMALNASYSTDGKIDVQFFEQGSLNMISKSAVPYAASGTAGTYSWKALT